MARVVRFCLPLFTTTVLALVAFGTSAASADTQIVGLGGWQVQTSATATQSGDQISTPGFPTGSWLHVRPDDAGAVGTEVNALVQTGQCPAVFFSTNMKDCFGYMDNIGADTIPEFSVPWWFRTDFFAGVGGVQITALHRPDHQRRRRSGRRVGQRARGGHAGHGPGRLHALHVRHHQPAARRPEHAGPRGVPEQPEHDVHARQRRLDADPAGQQHRHPVPDRAAHLRPARAEQRPRAAERRARSLKRRAHAQGRRHQPCRDHAGG